MLLILENDNVKFVIYINSIYKCLQEIVNQKIVYLKQTLQKRQPKKEHS